MRKALLVFFSIISFAMFWHIATALAQELPVFSEPLKLSEKGNFHTLVMQDGSTCLLHIETGKCIKFFYFDKSRKLVVSSNDVSKYLNTQNLDWFIFHAFCDINGEPTLFAEQRDDSNKVVLFRAHFSKTTGKIIKESIITRRNDSHINTFGIAFSSDFQYYSVGNSSDTSKTGSSVTFYNKLHERIRTVPINLNRDQWATFNHYECVNASINETGDLMMVMSVFVADKSTNANSHQYAVFVGLRHDDTTIRILTSDIGTNYYFHNAVVNSLGDNYHILLVAKDGQLVDEKDQLLSTGFYLCFDKDLKSITRVKKIKNMFCTYNKPFAKDIYDRFAGNPFGLACTGKTIFSMSQDIKGVRLNARIFMFQETHICVTRLDSNGSEISGTFVPLYQNTNWFQMTSFEKKFTGHAAMLIDSSICIIMNEEDKGGTAMFNYKRCQATLYSVSNDGELTRRTLFEESGNKEYRAIMLNGDAYNASLDLYASLVSINKFGKAQICMGWTHLK